MLVNTLTMTMAELYGNNEVLESTFKGALMPSVFRDDILKKTKENMKTMIFFENKLNDNENVLETKVEGNRVWIMLKENVSQVQDIFDIELCSYSGQLLNGIIDRDLFEIEGILFKVIKSNLFNLERNSLLIELKDKRDYICLRENDFEYSTGAGDIENVFTKKYKGIFYNKIKSYNGKFFRLYFDVNEYGFFANELNRIICKNLKDNNLLLENEKECREYISSVANEINEILDISKEINYISFSTEYKLNTILKQNDYNFESFIIESFKAGVITGIKDIDKYINKNNELCNKDHIAYIFINNDMRTLYIIRDSKGHRMCKVY